MDNKFQEQYDWQDKHIDEVIKILNKNLHLISEIRRSSFEEDTRFGKDIVLSFDSGDIAVRMRKDTIYRDLTIRSYKDTGYKTEIDKIKEGYTKWYFYCWFENNIMVEWWLIDVDKIRNSNILDTILDKYNGKGISNKDGSYFIAINKEELISIDAIVDTRKR